MARCGSRTDCIKKPICAAFYKLGHFVGSHPWWFLVIPLLVSGGLGTGFYFLKEYEANDIEDQFTPLDGAAKGERDIVQKYFPQNDSDLSSQRLYTEGTYASLIVVSKDNILTETAFKELIELDNIVKNITSDNNTYLDLCAKTNNTCVPNAILEIINYNASEIADINLTYPVYKSKIFLGTTVGGVDKSDQNLVYGAQAIRLVYYLRDEKTAKSWLEEFLEVLSKIESSDSIKVSYFTSVSRQQEFEENPRKVVPLFSITYFLAIFFSIVSCMRFDCVRNKVWVAIIGVLSAGLGVLSGFGMLLYCGMPFAMTVANAPFLILGIGVDDMFIMISCWQQTKVHDSVEDRLAETYKDAAVSITITTLTDVLAFYIGIMTPFRSVQSFCLYTGTAVLFCYLYNITFFGAFLALNGKREKSNRHWLTCMKVEQDCPAGRSTGYSMCCVGGAYDANTDCEKEQPVNLFFKKYYGPFLTNTWTKVFVVLLYGGYLASSIYGCLQMQEGIDLRNLAYDGSYVVNYYDDEDAYFSEYGPRVMVVVTEQVEYWNKEVRKDIESCLKVLENHLYVDASLSVSWLRVYENVSKLLNINLDNETVFKDNLKLILPTFKQDISISNDNIIASRFFIQTTNITTPIKEKNMLDELREDVKNCVVPVLVYHPAFIYFDQYAVIVSNTIQNIAVATAVMLVIALLLIPNPLCSLWVTFAIGSVIVGVAGFMAFWNVKLDSISMINLVICIGFSVDFSAHISYAFVSNSKHDVNEKAIDALHTLGYPIVQGAVSTILGVIVLAAAESYIFRTFFKIMFLVISFGALHGIVFIPVFLTFFGVCSKTGEVTSDEKIVVTGMTIKNGHCVEVTYNTGISFKYPVIVNTPNLKQEGGVDPAPIRDLSYKEKVQGLQATGQLDLDCPCS
ncbi:patched domain-containing protein 3-like [Acipenser ruthenus]|uniref:patched domain-containing protein 3-like n=1 Tax=Acipenser ruthenus TaxID=7906 RepID=UPI00145B237C|nr:patched domain-containing protein 3-like [Acipenser ruthenus]